ncbi:hypothetical protein LTR95_017690 [Oleoguttula sp. CCFEE 5521]
MTTYDSKIALNVLTEAEKDRMICIFLNNPERNTGVDWEKCITEAGSASISSFKKGLENSLKKLKNAQEGDDAEELATAKKTPKSTPAKRKAKTDTWNGDENGDDAAEGVTPRKTMKSTPAKRKGKSDAGDGEEGTPVKKKRGKKVDANGGAKSDAVIKAEDDNGEAA